MTEKKKSEKIPEITPEEAETLRKYGDIIDLPHHMSSVHPRMPASSRAAQFAPFSALTGLEDELDETARYTEDQRTLDENRREELDWKLQELGQMLKKSDAEQSPEVELQRFLPDARKSGGSYGMVRGRVRKIDTFRRSIIMEDGTEVPVDDITDIRFTEGEDK